MKVKNKYYYRSRISEKKFRAIIKYFCADLTADQTSEFCSLNRNTINKIYGKLRERLYDETQRESKFSGEVELDESYFGPTRVRGKRGRGTGGKTIVFGLLKREGKVFVEIVPDAKAKSLIPLIRGKVEIEDSIIHTDGWRAYDGLVDYGYEKHYRVHHGKNEFARGKKHINSIESFWSYAKRRLRKFNGIRKEKFYLHLKETEFRFNYRKENLYDKILTILRKNLL